MTALDIAPLRKRESHLWKRDEHDWYVEPEWCSQRLFDVESFDGMIFDPACGTGRIVYAARARGLFAEGADLVFRGFEPAYDEHRDRDFLRTYTCEKNIVCNPPFRLAEQFVRHALGLVERKVAMLLPAKWVQGDTRSRWLETTPLRRVYFLTPRPSMPPGEVIKAGLKPGNGTTDYAWFVFLRGFDGPAEIRWLRRKP